VLFSAWPRFDAVEVAFWRDLASALREHGLRLVLTSEAEAPDDLGVDHVAVPMSIDAIWPDAEAADTFVATEALGLDTGALLAREECWSGPMAVPRLELYRRRAIEQIARGWLDLLRRHQPAVVVIWNGQHVAELILETAARRGGARVLYVERAPVPQALFADSRGLSASSSVAARRRWPEPSARWRRAARIVAETLSEGRCTWWEQPMRRGGDRMALRAMLGASPGQQVVLFAGQVDEDSQQFLFAPGFPDNVSAFRWLLGALSGRPGVFVLGKHHPRSSTPPEMFQRELARSGVAGTWRTDVNLDDALRAADRVAAVNSTVLHEALARGLPALALGRWLLSGRGVAYEPGPNRCLAAVEAWLLGRDAPARTERWQRCLGFLLSTCIYAYQPGAGAGRLHGPRELARRLARMAAGDTRWRECADMLSVAESGRRTRRWRVPGETAPRSDLERWEQAHTLRHQLMCARHASLRGRAIVVWGTGTGGRIARALLCRAGVTVRAFTASRPDASTVDATPIVPPAALNTAAAFRDFVVVASTAHATITESLSNLGLRAGDDFVVLDCSALVECADLLDVQPS
jgi:hypothetical protein